METENKLLLEVSLQWEWPESVGAGGRYGSQEKLFLKIGEP